MCLQGPAKHCSLHYCHLPCHHKSSALFNLFTPWQSKISSNTDLHVLHGMVSIAYSTVFKHRLTLLYLALQLYKTPHVIIFSRFHTAFREHLGSKMKIRLRVHYVQIMFLSWVKGCDFKQKMSIATGEYF